jgi:hypothetical protein
VTDTFVDDRGSALRATWHADAGVVVVSLWRDATCVGTIRLDTADTARLAALLSSAVMEQLQPAAR